MASVVTTNDSSWTTPRTWTTGELVTKSIMDTHVRDNLNALHTPTSFYCVIDQGANYTYTTTTFADIDSTNLSSGARTWAGGLVLVGFSGSMQHSNNAAIFYLDVAIDGSRVGGDDGLIVVDQAATANEASNISFTTLIPVSAGSHTISIQWKTSGATLTLYAGAGTANYDIHPRFFGIEV